MSENGPIPDESVRSYAAWGDAPAWDLETGEDLSDPEGLQSLLIYVRLTARDLARELLALRKAARLIFDGMSGTWAEVDPPTLDVIRALLPEEAK